LTHCEQPAGIIERINAIETGGSTNLFGGWEAAAELLLANPGSGLNRVIVISDGCLNAGLTDPAVKAQRVAELEAAFRAGSHPSQVQRRKDEAWARRGAFMQVMAESRFQPLLHVLVDDLKTALPTDAKLPDEPTETEEQRRALLHRKVFGLKHIVRLVASFLPYD
jgi:hypothetical protein